MSRVFKITTITLLLLIIFTLIFGLTNPDINEHHDAIKEYCRKEYPKGSLYQELIKNGYSKFCYEVGNKLTENWLWYGPPKRENHIFYSKIEYITFGLLNKVWVSLDPKFMNVNCDLLYSFENYVIEELNNKIERLEFNDIVAISSIVLKHKYDASCNTKDEYGFRARPFLELRARAYYFLNEHKLALQDLKVLSKKNNLTFSSYYTYYLIFNNYFSEYYNEDKSNYYYDLYNANKY